MRKLLFILALAAMASCAKIYTYDGPDGVNSHLYEFKAKADTSLVLVYSTGKWTARLIDDAPWAEILDERYGTAPGAQAFSFACEENLSVSRQARVVVYFPEKRDTIIMRQSGKEVLFSLETQSVTLPATAGTCTLALTTNLLEEHIGDIEVQMTFEPALDAWISNVRVTKEAVSFDYGRMILSEERSAVLKFIYTDLGGAKIVEYPLNVSQK